MSVIIVASESCVDVCSKRVVVGDHVLVGAESREVFEALGLEEGRPNYVVGTGLGRGQLRQVPSPLRSLAAERPRLFRDVHTGDVFAHAAQWIAELATRLRDAGREVSPELSTARDWVSFASVHDAVRIIRRAAKPQKSLVVRLRCAATAVTLVDLQPRDRLVLHRCVCAAARGEFVPSRESPATRALDSAFKDATYVFTLSNDRAETALLLNLAANARRLVSGAPSPAATRSRASQTDEPLLSLPPPPPPRVEQDEDSSDHTSHLVQHYEAIIQGLQARLVERQVTIRHLRAQLHCSSAPPE